MSTVKVGRYGVEITNPDKILFPRQKITKGDLIAYYRDIARIMLPYVKDRPVTMRRFPHGIKGEGFYQKDIPDYFPRWIKRKKIKKKEEGTTTYVICNNAATLVYLANQACITPHIWLSRIDKLNYPDKMIFDLDPSGDKDFPLVRRVGKKMKALLEELGLTAFVKTTGSRGLHIVVPLDRRNSFDVTRSFARDVATVLVNQDPKHLTLEARKEKRRGRLLIDILRNAYAQTAAAPYAVRPKPGAPIATPLFWEELSDRRLTPQRYTIKNIFKRLTDYGDPWKGMGRKRNALTKAHRKLKELLG